MQYFTDSTGVPILCMKIFRQFFYKKPLYLVKNYN